MTFLLRRTICGHLRRSRPENILNVFQRIHLRFFLACGLASGRTSFASSRTAMSGRLLVLAAGLLWAAAHLSGCSAKEVRYPEDHARFTKIDKAVEALRDAYARRDLSDIQSQMLPREALEKAINDIQQDFQTFQEISLEWTIDRMLIDGETIEVIVSWAGQWQRTPADTGLRERGQGVLQWAGERSILLNGLSGDLPFGMALRRSATEPPRGGPPR